MVWAGTLLARELEGLGTSHAREFGSTGAPRARAHLVTSHPTACIVTSRTSRAREGEYPGAGRHVSVGVVGPSAHLLTD